MKSITKLLKKLFGKRKNKEIRKKDLTRKQVLQDIERIMKEQGITKWEIKTEGCFGEHLYIFEEPKNLPEWCWGFWSLFGSEYYNEYTSYHPAILFGGGSDKWHQVKLPKE